MRAHSTRSWWPLLNKNCRFGATGLNGRTWMMNRISMSFFAAISTAHHAVSVLIPSSFFLNPFRPEAGVRIWP